MSLENKVSKYDGVLGKFKLAEDKIMNLIVTFMAQPIIFYHTKNVLVTLEVAKTLSQYINHPQPELIVWAFLDTARYTKDKQATLEVAKTLSQYINHPQAGSIADKISKTAEQTKDKKATIQVAKLFQEQQIIDVFNQYINHPQAESIVWAISDTAFYTKDKQATLEVAKTLSQYINHPQAESIQVAIFRTAEETKDKQATLEVAKTLSQYINHPQVESIASLFSKTAVYTKDQQIIIKISKILSNSKDEIYSCNNLDLITENILEFTKSIQHQEIFDELKLSNYEKISKAYQVVQGIIENKTDELKQQAIEGFYTSLNKQISKGKTIQEKLKIINSWSNKIYNVILQNPDGFTYVVAK
ncbi:MAG: hypothetical protein AB7V77_01120 [Candidatus Woesearchaeota archaeon]